MPHTPTPAQEGVWISELNRRPEVRKDFASQKATKFYDTTLRDGEQSVGVVLTPQQKLEIARALDGLGVGRIEAGFPRVSVEDAEAFRLIANAGLQAEIWGFGRALRADIDELLRLGSRATMVAREPRLLQERAGLGSGGISDSRHHWRVRSGSRGILGRAGARVGRRASATALPWAQRFRLGHGVRGGGRARQR